MTFITVTPYFQFIAALLIFIASYLGIVICAIIGIVVAELVFSRTSLIRAYDVKSGLDRESTCI
jgi:hypothetical protein